MTSSNLKPLQELTAIERDIANLLSLASASIQSPTREGIAEYHKNLSSISARLHRQVIAIRSADIVVGMEPKGGERVGAEMERDIWAQSREVLEGSAAEEGGSQS